MNTYLIFDILMGIIGIILILQALQMKKSGEISTWLMSDTERKKCKKKESYLAYMVPREIFFGAGMTVLGVLGAIVEWKIFSIPYWNFIQMVLFLIFFLAFWTQMKDANRKYT